MQTVSRLIMCSVLARPVCLGIVQFIVFTSISTAFLSVL